MPSPLGIQERIAEILADHEPTCGDCTCGWESWDCGHSSHVASVLVAELGLMEDT